ncbi:hypothetical protein PIB30_009767 [Stylosanthes scabra]|uniref:Uncharacterized protein n=1 Tax=Stylosanthes scabra TaxID=79078 RepID=A0ABU6X4E0_9FABA|nr:hypothetical protein [Stylosanthes scabra]
MRLASLLINIFVWKWPAGFRPDRHQVSVSGILVTQDYNLVPKFRVKSSSTMGGVKPKTSRAMFSRDSSMAKPLKNEKALPNPGNMDLTSTSKEKDQSLKSFIGYACSRMINISPTAHSLLSVVCVYTLYYQLRHIRSKNFNFQLRETSHTQLSFEDAFPLFLPDILIISMFIMCFFIAFILLLLTESTKRLVFVTGLVSAAAYYFTKVAIVVPGVDVDCRTFKLPLLWFLAFTAFGLFQMCGFMSLVMVYLFWRYIQDSGRKVKELLASLNFKASSPFKSYTT